MIGWSQSNRACGILQYSFSSRVFVSSRTKAKQKPNSETSKLRELRGPEPSATVAVHRRALRGKHKLRSGLPDRRLFAAASQQLLSPPIMRADVRISQNKVRFRPTRLAFPCVGRLVFVPDPGDAFLSSRNSGSNNRETYITR